MNNTYRTRASWIFAAALLVAITTVITIAVLRQQAEQGRRAQGLLAELEQQVHHLQSLEWHAIADRQATPELRAETRGARRRMTLVLGQLSQSRQDIQADRMGRLQREYALAVDEEYRLLNEDRLAEARRVDTERVDPALDALHDTIAVAADIQRQATERKIRTADIGSALTAVAAIALIGLLLWQFDKTRRAMGAAQAEKNVLEASEERFRDLVQNSSDVTMILQPDATVSYVSASAQGVLDCRPEDLVGKSLVELADPSDAELLRGWLARCLDHPADTPIVEFSFPHSDGEPRHLEAIGNNRLQHAQVAGIVANIRDITERKRTHEQIAAQRTELQERNAELSALQKVSEVVSRATGVDQLLSQVLHTLTRIDILKDCRVGGIITVEGEKMRLSSYVGEPTEAFLREHEELRVGDCLCGLAVQTGEIVVSADCFEDARHTIRYPGMTPHGHVIVPLRVMDRILGALYVYLPAGTEVSERTRRTLLAVGEQVGTAVENVRLYEQTKELSLHDPLTGLANRRLMQIALQEDFARARRLGRPFSVVMMDLDFFKKYNDAYGHAAGDRLLAEVANLILKEIREIDLAVRYGGEEFLIVLPEAEIEAAAEVAERIRNKVMNADFFHAQDMPPSRITVSLGVAAYDDTVSGEAELVTKADDAMYTAKNRGRNRAEVWDG